MQFLEHLREWGTGSRYYIFVDKNVICPEIDGVEYIKIDVKNGFKRIKFDYWDCRMLLAIKGIIPDLIISLQNTGITCLKNIPQIIYYHQPLPIYPQHWNPLRCDERTLAFYKWIYPFFIKISYKKNNVDFVAQIQFIKDGIINRFNINPDHVHVLFPDVEKVNIENLKFYKFEPGTYNFLYPAVNVKYKNHLLLPEMMIELANYNERYSKNVRIHLTISSSDNPVLLRKIKEYGLSHNFVFHGVITHQDLLSMYSSCHGLLFPSTIETLGLPLIEAGRFGVGIIASDLDYAHQVMGNYQGIFYEDANNAPDWARQLLTLCLEKPQRFPYLKEREYSSWCDFFRLVNQKLICR